MGMSEAPDRGFVTTTVDTVVNWARTGSMWPMTFGWVLGHTDDHDEVMAMMRKPVSHEITKREPHNGYLILQGGLPDVEEFITDHWK